MGVYECKSICVHVGISVYVGESLKGPSHVASTATPVFAMESYSTSSYESTHMQLKEGWMFSNFNDRINYSSFFNIPFNDIFSDSEISNNIDATTTLSVNLPLGNNGPLSSPDFTQSSETAQSSEMAQSPEVSGLNPVFPPIWGALSNGCRVMGGILEFIPQDIPEAQSLPVCGFIYTGNYYL